jgi:phosphate uptake regulator
MERKLIKQGGGGYTIYLPKKWLNKKGLKGGDIVKIKELETSLLINTEIKENKEITININNENKKDISSILTHAYRKGFNTITINNVDKNLVKQIKHITKELLLGFEITEKTLSEIKIGNISEPTEQKYDIMLKKVFLLIKETQSLVLEDLQNKYKNLEEIEEMKNNSDKFILFCRRLLTKEKYEKTTFLEWELLTFLMHIQHTYYYLYKYTKDNKLKPEKALINLLEELKKYFLLFENAYYNKSIEPIHKINNLKTKYQFKVCLEAIEKTKGKSSVLASYIRELFRLIQIGTSPILTKLIESNLKK